jgi:hypothetical protein
MPLLYVGDATFQETESSGRMGTDLFGADVLTREWEGSKELISDFIADSFRFTITGSVGNGRPIVIDRSRKIQDRELRAMYLTEFNVEKSRAFAKITGTFRGIANGRKPEVVISYGTKATSVTLPYIGSELGVGNGISASFTYYAPYATYRYLTKDKPTKPQNLGRVENMKAGIRVAARTGAAGPLVAFKGRTLTNQSPNVMSRSITGGLNAYNAVIECINEEWDVQPLGSWWEVTETNQIILTPLDLASGGWAFQV